MGFHIRYPISPDQVIASHTRIGASEGFQSGTDGSTRSTSFATKDVATVAHLMSNTSFSHESSLSQKFQTGQQPPIRTSFVPKLTRGKKGQVFRGSEAQVVDDPVCVQRILGSVRPSDRRITLVTPTTTSVQKTELTLSVASVTKRDVKRPLVPLRMWPPEGDITIHEVSYGPIELGASRS